MKRLIAISLSIMMLVASISVYAEEMDKNTNSYELLKNKNYTVMSRGIIDNDNIEISYEEGILDNGKRYLKTIENGVEHYSIFEYGNSEIIYDGDSIDANEFITIESLENVDVQNLGIESVLQRSVDQTWTRKGSVEFDLKVYKSVNFLAAAICSAIPGGQPVAAFLGLASIWIDAGPYEKAYYIQVVHRTDKNCSIYPYKDEITTTYYKYKYYHKIGKTNYTKYPLLP